MGHMIIAMQICCIWPECASLAAYSIHINPSSSIIIEILSLSLSFIGTCQLNRFLDEYKIHHILE